MCPFGRRRGSAASSTGHRWRPGRRTIQTTCRLVDHEAGILFTEDDLLWWRLKPAPDAELDFQYGDRFFEIAEQQGQLVFGAHLVWDEGFGEGWTDDDIWGLDEDGRKRT